MLLDPLRPDPNETTLRALLRKPSFLVVSLVLLFLVLVVLNRAEPVSVSPTQPRSVATAARATNYQPPTMFANIKSWTPTETDCVNLRTWFDGADNMHGRAVGDLDAMRWYTDLMVQLDARMEAAGCYG